MKPILSFLLATLWMVQLCQAAPGSKRIQMCVAEPDALKPALEWRASHDSALMGFLVGSGAFCMVQVKEGLRMIEDLSFEFSPFTAAVHEEQSQCFQLLNSSSGDLRDDPTMEQAPTFVQVSALARAGSNFFPRAGRKFYPGLTIQLFVVGPWEATQDGVRRIAAARTPEEAGSAVTQTMSGALAMMPIAMGGAALLRTTYSTLVGPLGTIGSHFGSGTMPPGLVMAVAGDGIVVGAAPLALPLAAEGISCGPWTASSLAFAAAQGGRGQEPPEVPDFKSFSLEEFRTYFSGVVHKVETLLDPEVAEAVQVGRLRMEELGVKYRGPDDVVNQFVIKCLERVNRGNFSEVLKLRTDINAELESALQTSGNGNLVNMAKEIKSRIWARQTKLAVDPAFARSSSSLQGLRNIYDTLLREADELKGMNVEEVLPLDLKQTMESEYLALKRAAGMAKEGHRRPPTR